MDSVIARVEKVFREKHFCSLAATDGKNVDNAMVAYYSEGLNLYFGSFSDTLKCRYIKNSPQVAVCIDQIQMHGMARRLEPESNEYREYLQEYLTKFPQYQFYFELENNELYRIEPLVIWLYDGTKGTMYRERIVLDENYYRELKPYEAPPQFNKKN